MYFFIKTAKKATTNHHDFSGDFSAKCPKSIKKGDVYFAISNGTIGHGARQRNMGREQAIEILESYLRQLKANKEDEIIIPEDDETLIEKAG
jgi:hypothetical protein